MKNNYSLYLRNNLECFAVYVAMLTNSQVPCIHADIIYIDIYIVVLASNLLSTIVTLSQ